VGLLGNKNFWYYAAAVLFIVINTFLLAKEIWLFAFFPFAILIAYLYITSLDKVFLLITFLTPLSLPLQDLIPEMPFDISLPVEPMILILMGVFVLKLFKEKSYPKKFILHPVSLAIIFHLIWMTVTTLTSSMPLVSMKFLLARFWFVITFFYFALIVFNDRKNIKRYLYLFVIGLSIAAFYSLVKHALVGINDQAAAYKISWPFFNDHTVYGAVLAFYFPIVIGFFVLAKESNHKTLLLILIAFLGFAIIHSYSRASWLSILASFALWGVLRLKISFRVLMETVIGFAGILFLFSTTLIMQLEENKTDSSDDFKEHIQSMTNIKTDASNVERLNRWKCAFEMFKERPVFGWGPGTYMFQYAPFQKERDRTVISTNWGDWGNAHSEYIGPLAESGVFGSLSMIAIVLLSVYTGFNVVYKSTDIWMKVTAITVLMGLATYVVHGILNNFLDTVKASVPFWGFTAILVFFDIYLKEKGQKLPEN